KVSNIKGLGAILRCEMMPKSNYFEIKLLYNIIHRDNIVKHLKNSIFSLTTNNKNVILIT
ncbi:hypothetical protein, partial [Streptococcus pneumoniae]|uniref:hypothetical protein n=1 Tax=Streptococcus pneumoniae TaxID=1313 RepID=UPI00067BF4F0